MLLPRQATPSRSSEYVRTLSRMGWSMLLFIGLFYATNLPAEMLSPEISLLTNPSARFVLRLVEGIVSTVAYVLPFVVAGVFFLLLSRKGKTERMWLELRFTPEFPLLILAGLAVIYAGSYVNGIFCELIGYVSAPNTEDMLSVVYDNPSAVILYMTTAIAPAFAEEFLFRGVFYGNLRPFGRTQAVLVSSLLFALMHENIAQLFYTFLAGICMALMYELTGSIWCSVLFHLLNNELSVITEVLYSRYGEGFELISILMDVVIFVTGLLSVLVLVLTRRNRRQGSRKAGTYGREVPPRPELSQDASPASLTPAAPVSASTVMRGLLTPGIVVFTAVTCGLMLLSWMGLLLSNMLGG